MVPMHSMRSLLVGYTIEDKEVVYLEYIMLHLLLFHCQRPCKTQRSQWQIQTQLTVHTYMRDHQWKTSTEQTQSFDFGRTISHIILQTSEQTIHKW